MTFADGVLRLVRVGARIELRDDGPASAQADNLADAMLLNPEGLPVARPGGFAGHAGAVAYEEAAANLALTEPGLADLESAVALVESGVASRVVLAGFPSWPGLLWRAYQLADAAKVVILPTVVRPGGLVDIVITRDSATDV
jgi:hypothetical protein